VTRKCIGCHLSWPLSCYEARGRWCRYCRRPVPLERKKVALVAVLGRMAIGATLQQIGAALGRSPSYWGNLESGRTAHTVEQVHAMLEQAAKGL
jgi:hypothetical protein